MYELDIPWRYPAHTLSGDRVQFLAFTDSKHLGAAYRADPLRCWFAVLHRYSPGILHFPLRPALYTVSLHLVTSLGLYLG